MDTNTYLSPGLSLEETYTVQKEHSAQHLGSGDVGVLATPMMILFMEKTARILLNSHLPTGYSSVGVHVDVRHLAPTPIGAQVRVTAEVLAVNGNQVTLSINAWDAHEQIGTGQHMRVVIDESRFLRRVDAKA